MIARLSCDRSGVGIVASIAWIKISRFTSWWADTGIIGEFSVFLSKIRDFFV